MTTHIPKIPFGFSPNATIRSHATWHLARYSLPKCIDPRLQDLPRATTDHPKVAPAVRSLHTHIPVEVRTPEAVELTLASRPRARTTRYVRVEVHRKNRRCVQRPRGRVVEARAIFCFRRGHQGCSVPGRDGAHLAGLLRRPWCVPGCAGVVISRWPFLLCYEMKRFSRSDRDRVYIAQQLPKWQPSGQRCSEGQTYWIASKKWSESKYIDCTSVYSAGNSRPTRVTRTSRRHASGLFRIF